MSQHLPAHNHLEEQSECPACGFMDTGRFCSSCGSVIKNYRINLSSLITNILEWEDKVTFTTSQLLFRPVSFLKGYLDGNRLRTYIPFKYLFFSFGLFCLVSETFSIETLYSDPTDTMAQTLFQSESEMMFEHVVGKFGKFFTLLFIPFYLLASRMFFPKARFNMAERTTVITYMLGMLMMVHMVLSLVTALIHPFYFIKPYLILFVEFYILFILSYRFFDESLKHSLWKTPACFAVIMAGMYCVMMTLDTVIQLFY